MIHMHHQIAGAERLCLGQEILGPALALGLADQPVTQHVLFGNDRQIRGLKPVFQCPNSKVQTPLADPRSIGDRDHLGQPFVFDQASQPLACAVRVAGHHHRAPFKPCPNVPRQGTKQADAFLLPFWRKIAADAPTRVRDAEAGGLRQSGKLDDPVVRYCRMPSNVIKVQGTGRCRLIDTVHL